MILVDIINLADSIKGPFVDLGFGAGKDSREIFNLMLEKKVKSRDFYLVDLFQGGKKGTWQKAHDMCNEVRNRLKQAGNYTTCDITKESVHFSQAPALVNIDLEDATASGLKFILPLMNKKGIVILRNYDKVKPSVLEVFNEVSTASKVVEGENYSYIIKDDYVRSINKVKIKRTRSVLT